MDTNEDFVLKHESLIIIFSIIFLHFQKNTKIFLIFATKKKSSSTKCPISFFSKLQHENRASPTLSSTHNLSLINQRNQFQTRGQRSSLTIPILLSTPVEASSTSKHRTQKLGLSRHGINVVTFYCRLVGRN